MTRAQRRRAAWEHLRAIARRPDRASYLERVAAARARVEADKKRGVATPDDVAQLARRSRVRPVNITRRPQDRVWEPDTPSRAWFEREGIEPVTASDMGQSPRRWWRRAG